MSNTTKSTRRSKVKPTKAEPHYVITWQTSDEAAARVVAENAELRMIIAELQTQLLARRLEACALRAKKDPVGWAAKVSK